MLEGYEDFFMDPVSNPAQVIIQGLQTAADDHNSSRPCIFYCLSLGSIVALTAAVALAVIGMTPLAVILGSLSLIDMVGAYYAPRRSVEDLQERFSRDLPVLRQETVRWETMLRQERTEHRTTQATIEDLRSQISQKNTALEQTVAQLKSMEARHSNLAVESAEIKSSAKIIRTNSKRILAAEEQAQSGLEGITKQVSHMQSNVDIIGSGIVQMNKSTETEQKLAQELELVRVQLAQKEDDNKKLGEKIVSLTEQIKNLGKQREETNQRLDKLTTALSPRSTKPQ